MATSPHKPSDSELTQFLVDLGQGRADPDSALMRYVYDQLRATAEAYMRDQKGAPSLQPTALVHDAFVKLFDRGPIEWNDRVHFFALAAKAMRQILVDHARARRRRSSTRGDGSTIALEDFAISKVEVNVDLIDLDEALRDLAEVDERESRVVELRYFGGLSIEDVASVLDVSRATVERDWATARVWLGRRLAGRGAS